MERRAVHYVEPRAAFDIPDVLRVSAVIFIYYVAVVGAGAFHDLRSVSNVSVSESGNSLTQVLFSAVALIVLTVLAVRGLRLISPLASVPALLTMGWFILTTVTSTEVVLSARRLALLLICTLAASCVFLLSRSVRQFAIALAAISLLILGLSYAALVVVPELAIHSSMDLREPEHAGDWRGIFPHKNEAGAVMVTLIFAGLFLARVLHPLLGYAVIIASAAFLAFSEAKTAIGMLPVVLGQSWLCTLWKDRFRRTIVILAPLIIALTLSVGTVYIPAVATLVTKTVPGADYTGRTDIWKFAAENIAKHPIVGFGYGAFWQTEETFYGEADSISWVNKAGDAHDGYLNTALQIGWPGLVLTVIWLILEPIRNLQLRVEGPELDATSLLFVRWLCFALLLAVFEGVLYNPTSGGYFILMIAAFGLRYRTKATLRLA